MGPALLSWLRGQNGSWKCLISWKRCNSTPQTGMQDVVKYTSSDLAFFCFLPESTDKLFFSSLCSFFRGCFANCVTFMAQMSTHPSLHPCQMDGMFTVIVLHIHRQLIRRQESFRPDQINGGNTELQGPCPCPCHALPPTRGIFHLQQIQPELQKRSQWWIVTSAKYKWDTHFKCKYIYFQCLGLELILCFTPSFCAPAKSHLHVFLFKADWMKQGKINSKL